MTPYIESWNSLETIGPKGNGFNPNTDKARNAGRLALKYASLAGLAISLFTLATAVA